VVVVGGGVAGLTAAHALVRGGARVLVLEASDRWGGVVQTVREDGLLLETGPDAMLATKPDGVALVRALGLGDRIVPTNPDQRTVYVVRGGSLHPMPEGMVLGVPTRALPVLRSGLFSWPGKLRLLAEPLVRSRSPEPDESIACFARRRLGREGWERLADPLLGGIHAGDTETLSVRATFPRLVELEARHGSLVRGMRALAAQRAADTGAAFVSLEGGLSDLVGALVRALPADALRTRAPVRALGRAGDGWQVSTADDTVEARAVVLALPAPRAHPLLRPLDEALAAELAAIRFESTGIVLLAFDRAAVAHPLDGYGLLIPRAEGGRLTACGFFSTKFPGRAPAERVTLRAFLGSSHDRTVLDLDDREMAAVALDELTPLLGLRGAPSHVRVCRWPESTPQMALGHAERARRIDERCLLLPGLHLTGAGLRVTGLPDTIADATAAAERVLAAAGREAAPGAGGRSGG
jgi:oxygen-dependent protoporphyrinogen oxidase